MTDSFCVFCVPIRDTRIPARCRVGIIYLDRAHRGIRGGTICERCYQVLMGKEKVEKALEINVPKNKKVLEVRNKDEFKEAVKQVKEHAKTE